MNKLSLAATMSTHLFQIVLVNRDLKRLKIGYNIYTISAFF